MPVIRLRPRALLPVLALSLLAACDPSEVGRGEGSEKAPAGERTSPEAALSVPPFERLKPARLELALESAVARADETLSRIVEQNAAPDFENTLLPLQQAGQGVARVARLWYGMTAVGSWSPEGDGNSAFGQTLRAYQQRVLREPALFERIDRIRSAPDFEHLDKEKRRLVTETWRELRRHGAHLDPARRRELTELEQRITALDERYARKRRSATHRHELLFEDDTSLRSLPEELRALARQSARDRGHAEGWAITLHAHSFYPFMRHHQTREDRRILYRSWTARYRDVLRSDEDLGRLIERLADLRARRARLLGFESHLDYLLDEAALPDGRALDQWMARLATAARAKAREEMARISALAAADGVREPLAPWDWWFYRERLHEAELGLQERDLRPFFPYESVRAGLFSLAGRLWGLRFEPRADLPTWHGEVSAFEVRDRSGDLLGLVFFDPFHRTGKNGGAWTSFFRLQHRRNGLRSLPIAAVVTNLERPTRGADALLSPQEVRTLFHEFGHALHGVLSDVEHAALAGTNVPPGFVEFPALLFERWAMQPESLRNYARHHESGEPIGEALVSALQRQPTVTAGLETLELLAAIELERLLHGAAPGRVPGLQDAERQVRERLELPEMISPRHHGGGLASLFASHRRGGDLRTLWSELLAADAFAAFGAEGRRSHGPAQRLRREVLARGNSREPMDSWRAFRGRAPEIGHLLSERGLGSGQTWNTPGGE